MISRRHLSLLAAASALCLANAHAQTKPYPHQPITVIVPFSPGGNVDVTTRIVTQAMGKAMGATVIVDNRAGAGGLIGLEAVSRAQPDGYTLVAGSNGSYTVSPRMVKRKSITMNDFVPVGMMTATPMVLVVPASSQFKSFAEFAAAAKANPGKLAIGHPGNGTTNHTTILKLEELLGTTFTVVPYKGSAAAMTDVVGGQIDAMVDQIPGAMPHVAGNRIRALAITGKARAADLPQVPTMTEVGLREPGQVTTTGLLAPAKTPPEVVATLNAALAKALTSPDVQKQLAAIGSLPQPLSQKDFAAYVKAEDDGAALLFQKGLLKPE